MVFTVERISHNGALVLAPPALKLLGSILCPLEHLVQLRQPKIVCAGGVGSDITPNTLRFSIYPAMAYTEPVKALDDRNQSTLIIVSISGTSLRLRPNTPTLTSASHRHTVILPMGFRGGQSRAKLFSVPSVKHDLISHSYKYPILKYMRTMPLCLTPHAQIRY